jgi:hypothetical protein
MAIFADLCLKLHPQPEVFATDALALLLQEHALGDALVRFLSTHLEMASAISSNLKFDKQDLHKDTETTRYHSHCKCATVPDS